MTFWQTVAAIFTGLVLFTLALLLAASVAADSTDAIVGIALVGGPLVAVATAHAFRRP